MTAELNLLLRSNAPNPRGSRQFTTNLMTKELNLLLSLTTIAFPEWLQTKVPSNECYSRQTKRNANRPATLLFSPTTGYWKGCGFSSGWNLLTTGDGSVYPATPPILCCFCSGTSAMVNHQDLDQRLEMYKTERTSSGGDL